MSIHALHPMVQSDRERERWAEGIKSVVVLTLSAEQVKPGGALRLSLLFIHLHKAGQHYCFHISVYMRTQQQLI